MLDAHKARRLRRLFSVLLLALVGCATPPILRPGGLGPPGQDIHFGSPSTGALLLFAERGEYEIWRINSNGLLPENWLSAVGDLGPNVRLIGVSIGRRFTSVLSQSDDGTLGLHRLNANGLTTARVPLTRQPSGGRKALSYSALLRNPKECLAGETESVLLLERPADSAFLDEVWIVSENGLVKQSLAFRRPSGFIPLAAGMGAVESPQIWILFASVDMSQAKLVQTRTEDGSPNELLITGIEVPFVRPESVSANRDRASGFSFATTVRTDLRTPGSYLFWWHVYKWRHTSPDRTSFVIAQEPGGSDFSAFHPILVRAGSPPPLDLVAFADRRPACLKWELRPYPPRLREEQDRWESFDGALEFDSPLHR